jgi:hypothetical protein
VGARTLAPTPESPLCCGQVTPSWKDFVGMCNSRLPPSAIGEGALVEQDARRQLQQDTGEFMRQLIDVLSTAKSSDGELLLARGSSIRRNASDCPEPAEERDRYR